MKNISLKSKISILLILASLSIFIFSFFRESEGLNEKFFGGFDKKDQAISQEKFDKYFKVHASNKKYDGILIFIVGDEFCASCLNEIIEYANATTEYLNSSLNLYNIMQYAFIIGDNKKDYVQVNKLLSFPFGSKLVKRGSELHSIFKHWSRDITGINQLALVDLEEKALTARIGIFNKATPPYQKKNLVQELLFELED